MATLGLDNLVAGDRIISTVLEHHSDFVPWQQLAKDVGAQIVMIDVDDDGRLRRDQLSAELKQGAKLLAITHTSNGLGVVNPIKEIVAEAHAAGATVLVDAAQAVPHTPWTYGSRRRLPVLSAPDARAAGSGAVGPASAPRAHAPFLFAAT